MSEKLLSVGKAAKLLGVSTETIREWADSGALKTYRSVGNHRRFSEAEIFSLSENGISERIESLRKLMGIPDECVLCWISAEDGKKLSGSAMVLDGGALHLKLGAEEA